MECDIFIFSGEQSGDKHAAALITALKDRMPNLKISGVAGPLMRACSTDFIMPMEEFQVMGFIDVIKTLPSLIKKFFIIRNAILKSNPKVVITVDYAYFSLKLAQSLRKKNFKGKICHYICPSVWAWGKKRIDVMSDHLDLLLTIFPFEKEFFASKPLLVEYVGNPLVKTIPPKQRPLKQEDSDQFIAVFPGSREKEIVRNLPIYLSVIEKLHEKYPHLIFGISISHPKYRELILGMIESKNLSAARAIQFFDNTQSKEWMEKSFGALAKCGTIALELALFEIPTIVTYSVASLDLFLAKYLFRINLKHYSLPNILLSKQVFPELIGEALSHERLLKLFEECLLSPSWRNECQKSCREVRDILGKEDGSRNAASLIISLLKP